MISVVVPAYNEEKEISHCLEFLARQQTSREFEVILVDNASTDATVEVAKQFLNKLSLRIISEPKKGRGAARAAGFRAAQGEIILSTDADTKVPVDWVDKLTSGLVQSGAKAAAGVTNIGELSKARTAFFNWFYPKYHFLYRCLLGHYCPVGFNFAVYKDAYIRSGGFNSDLKAMEDLDLGFKLKKIGRIAFLPSVVVTFSGRRFKKGFVHGFSEYFIEFIYYYFSGKKRADLSDVR